VNEQKQHIPNINSIYKGFTKGKLLETTDIKKLEVVEMDKSKEKKSRKNSIQPESEPEEVAE